MHAAILLIAWFFINASQSYAQLGHAQSNNWFEITKTPVTCIGSSVAEIDGKLYMIGGELLPPKPRMGISDVRIYDIEADEWTIGTHMPTARPLVPKLNIGNKIYAIGGFRDDTLSWNRVEVYDVSSDTWTRVADMPTSRRYPAACVYDGKIYVMGGISPSGFEKGLDIVERYDPATNTWDTCAPMITGRFVSTACVLYDSIYVIGGIEEAAGDWPGLSTVEVYDPRTDKWAQKRNLLITRSELTNVVLDGKIYAIGGFPDGHGRTVRSNFEVYDPDSGTWTLHNDPEDLHPQGAAYHAINVDDRIYVLNAVGPYTSFHPILPEVYVYNKPVIKVMSNPLIAVKDTLIANVLEPCTIYIVPPGTPAKIDSIIEDSIIFFDAQAIQEHRFALGGLHPGTYLAYAVALDGRIDLNYFQFRVMESIPEVIAQVIDEYTMEKLSVCQVYLNGNLFEKESEEALSLTGWAYDTCSIHITKSDYVDFDTTVVVKSDTTFEFFLDYGPPEAELEIFGGPIFEKSDYLRMKMNQNGTIYITPEDTPAVADSIIENAIASYPIYVNQAVIESAENIPLGTYTIYGISLKGRFAVESHVVQVIDHFPVCIIRVQDAHSKEPIDSCLLVVDSQDTIPGTHGEFDLTGWVYDSCTISITKKGYPEFNETLVVLNDTIHMIMLTIVGIDRVSDPVDQEISIYPNPTHDQITVQTRGQGICSLEIITLNGQILKKLEDAGNLVQVDISSYQCGIYLIRIVSRDKVNMGRVIKY